MTLISTPGSFEANSYVDLEFANNYFASHPFYSEAWDDLAATPERQEALLQAASRDLDTMFSWVGTPTSATQALRWPRRGTVNMDGLPYADNVIPWVLRQAVCEHARYLSSSEGNPDAQADTGGVSELKVDVITLKFEGSVTPKPVPSAVLRLLRGLATPYNRSRVGKVQVAL